LNSRRWPEVVHLAGPALDAEHHLQPALRIELVDDVRTDVGHPDVVVAVDPQPVRALEHAVAIGADEVAVGVELDQRARPAVQQEDVALRIDRDAGHAAEIHARRQLEVVGDGNVVTHTASPCPKHRRPLSIRHPEVLGRRPSLEG
jgi:hypothetical protein